MAVQTRVGKEEEGALMLHKLGIWEGQHCARADAGVQAPIRKTYTHMYARAHTQARFKVAIQLRTHDRCACARSYRTASAAAYRTSCSGCSQESQPEPSENTARPPLSRQCTRATVWQHTNCAALSTPGQAEQPLCCSTVEPTTRPASLASSTRLGVVDPTPLFRLAWPGAGAKETFP